jgi:hypothetical protein
MNQCLPIAYRTDPFDYSKIEQMRVAPGTSLTEIVERVAALAKIPDDSFIVCVNGEFVPQVYWHLIRTKITDAAGVITLHPMPDGGNFGRIAAILAAAALVVGTGFIGAAGIPILGIAGGSLAASAAAAGFGIAGSLALSALTAPPLAPSAKTGARAEKAIAGISANPLSPGDYLPRVLGRIRFPPPFLSMPFTTLENTEVYINGIIGLAGAYEITNLLLNGSDVALFEDFTYSIRQGFSDDAAPEMAFNPLVIENRPNFAMSKLKFQDDDDNLLDTTDGVAEAYTKWHTFTASAPGPDGRIVIRWAWNGGLTIFQRDADIARGGIAVRIEIKPRSSSTWYRLPELHFQGFGVSTSPVRQTVDLEFVDAVSSTEGTTDNKKAAWLVYWRAAGGHANQRDAEAVYQAAVNNYAAKGVARNANDGFTVDVDQTAINPNEDIDVRIRMSSPYGRSNWGITGYTYDGDANHGASLFHHYNTNEVVTNAGSPAANVIVESVASYSIENAFDYSGIASIAFRAKGIQIDSLTAEFTSIVPVWDGNAWTHSAPEASRNPAALYRDVLLGDLTSQPIPGEIIDEDNLIDWYEHCEIMDYQCNAVVQNMSVPQVLQLIASAGWASPRYADIWGVIIERSRSGEDIMQMLTPLNSTDIGTTKEYPDLPHAIRAEIFDEDEQYALRDDVVAYAPGFDATNATLIESIPYDGHTKAAKALDRAQLDIDQLHLRAIRYVRDVHFEGLLTPRGSLIGLTDEVIERPQRYSIVKEVLTGGGLITGLVLQAVIDLAQAATDISSVEDVTTVPDLTDPDIPLGASVRLDSGAPSAHEINEDTLTDTITFVTPFADPGIHAGQIVSLGQLGRETKRVLVMAVEPQNDEVFRLFLADEAPEIHGT